MLLRRMTSTVIQRWCPLSQCSDSRLSHERYIFPELEARGHCKVNKGCIYGLLRVTSSPAEPPEDGEWDKRNEARTFGRDNHEVDSIFGVSAAPGPWASCVQLLTAPILGDVHTVLW